MLSTFERLYGRLARAALAVLYAALGSLGLAVACALLGLRDAVVSFRSVAAALGFIFGLMLAVFLGASVAAAAVRYLHRRARRTA